VIKVAPRSATLRDSDAGLGVDANTFHQSEVDQQPIVAGTEPGETVTAASDRDRKIVLVGESDRGDHVGTTGRSGDQGRPAIDARIPHLTDVVVVGVRRRQDGPAHRPAQQVCGNFGLGLRGGICVRCHGCQDAPVGLTSA
jgi:hypothetical protein